MIPQPVDTYLEYYASVDGAPNKVFPAPALVPVGTPYGGPMAELVVHLDGEPTTHFTHTPEGTITFPQALPTGTRVQIWRYTDVSQGVVVFPSPTLYSPRDANKAVTQVLLGIQELWGRLLELWRYVKWLKVFLEGLIQELKEYTDGEIQNWVSFMLEQFLSVRGYIDQKVSDLTSYIDQKASALTSYIDQKVATLASLISGQLEALGDSVDQRFSALETYVNNKFTALGVKIDQDIIGLRQWASEEIQTLSTIMGNRVTEVWDYLDAQLPQFPVLVEEKVGELKDYVDGLYSNVVNVTVPNMWNDLYGRIQTLRETVDAVSSNSRDYTDQAVVGLHAYMNQQLTILRDYTNQKISILEEFLIGGRIDRRISALKNYVDERLQPQTRTHSGTWGEGVSSITIPFRVTRGLMFVGGATYDLSHAEQGLSLAVQEDFTTVITLDTPPLSDLTFTLVGFFSPGEQIGSQAKTYSGTWVQGETFVDVPIKITEGLLFLGSVTYDLSQTTQGLALTPMGDYLTRITLVEAPVVDLGFTWVSLVTPNEYPQPQTRTHTGTWTSGAETINVPFRVAKGLLLFGGITYDLSRTDQGLTLAIQEDLTTQITLDTAPSGDIQFTLVIFTHTSESPAFQTGSHSGTWAKDEGYIDVPLKISSGLLFLGGATYDLSRSDQGLTLSHLGDSTTRLSLDKAPVVDLAFTLLMFS